MSHENAVSKSPVPLVLATLASAACADCKRHAALLTPNLFLPQRPCQVDTDRATVSRQLLSFKLPDTEDSQVINSSFASMV